MGGYEEHYARFSSSLRIELLKHKKYKHNFVRFKYDNYFTNFPWCSNVFENSCFIGEFTEYLLTNIENQFHVMNVNKFCDAKEGKDYISSDTSSDTISDINAVENQNQNIE